MEMEGGVTTAEVGEADDGAEVREADDGADVAVAARVAAAAVEVGPDAAAPNSRKSHTSLSRAHSSWR